MGLNTELVEAISNDKSVEAVKILLESLSQKYNTSAEEIVKAFSSSSQEIPLSAFANNKISTLEIVVKYLKENLDKKYSEIALLLNRDQRTIWSTYNNSIKKYSKKLDISSKETIPVSIFSNREKNVLETIVVFLKNKGKSFSDIARLLNKDYQTIYTSYRRGDAR